jgi:hypothetical protein
MRFPDSAPDARSRVLERKVADARRTKNGWVERDALNGVTRVEARRFTAAGFLSFAVREGISSSFFG